ncbi:MAG: indole-3-glycerol phosphate synthase TrpC [Elioraea sp.]|nr:indole-3-glycerol phosphate synthase TrpC [Elioraea sp.]
MSEGILARILAAKREELSARRGRQPLAELRARARDLPPTRSLAGALAARIAADGLAVIAELKRASPSQGRSREDFRPAEHAAAYARAGAAALSVLTERQFFEGSDEHLAEARGAVSLPVLRESRTLGADAVLLIAAALPASALTELAGLAAELDLEVLIEVHEEAELEAALAAPAALIGINNRDLRSFRVELATTLRLAPRIPPGRLAVSESGFARGEELAQVTAAGVRAFLIGERLMREADPGAGLIRLLADARRAGRAPAPPP